MSSRQFGAVWSEGREGVLTTRTVRKCLLESGLAPCVAADSTESRAESYMAPTPGEGEHKIMDYIRYMRAQPGYDPNTRHCLYGLDADLIMLGLCTHEPHFSLLREEVLMGFLVGNDFIPNLPNLHIVNGSLPILYQTYMKVLPTFDGKIPLMAMKMGENSEYEDYDDSDSDKMFQEEFRLHKRDYYTNKLEYKNVTNEVLRAQAEGYVRAIQWNLNYYYNGVCSWSWFYPHHYAPYISDIQGFADLKIEFDLGTPFLPYEQLLAVLPAASKNLLPDVYHHLMTDENSLIKPYYPEEFETDLNGKKAEWEAVVLIPFIDEDKLLSAMAECNLKLTPEEVKRNSHGPMRIYQYTSTPQGEYQAPEYFPPVIPHYATCSQLTIDDIRIPPEKLIKGAYPGVILDIYFPGFPTTKHLKYTHHLEKAHVKVHEQTSRNDNMILTIEKLLETPGLDVLARQLLGRTVYVAWPHLIEGLVVTVSNKEFRYHSIGEPGQYNVVENKGNLEQNWNLEKSGTIDLYRNRFGVEVGKTDVLIHVKVLIGRRYMFTRQGRVTLEKQWAPITTAYPLQVIVRDITVHDEKYSTFRDLESIFPPGSTCFMLGQPHYGSMGEVKESREATQNGRVKVAMQCIDEPTFESIKQFEKRIKVKYMNSYDAAVKLGELMIVTTLDRMWILYILAVSRQLFTRVTGSILVSVSSRFNSTEDTNKVNIGLNLKFSKRNEEIPGYTKREGNLWLYSEKAIELVKAYNEFCPSLFEYLNRYNENVYYLEDIFPGANGKERLSELSAWIKAQPYYSVERRPCGTHILEPEVVKKIQEIVDNSKLIKPKEIVMKIKPHILYKFRPISIYISAMDKRMRVQVHWDLLIDFLEVHPELLTGKFTTQNSRQRSVQLWEEVSQKLNSLGLRVKTPEKWKIAVIDWKYKPDLYIGNVVPDANSKFQLYDRVVNVRESYTVPLGLRGTVIAVHKSEGDSNDDVLYDIVFDEEFPGGLSLNCCVNRGYRLPKSALINKSYGQRDYEFKAGKTATGELTQQMRTRQNMDISHRQYNAAQHSAFVACPPGKTGPPVYPPYMYQNSYNNAYIHPQPQLSRMQQPVPPPIISQQSRNFMPMFASNEKPKSNAASLPKSQYPSSNRQGRSGEKKIEPHEGVDVKLITIFHYVDEGEYRLPKESAKNQSTIKYGKGTSPETSKSGRRIHVLLIYLQHAKKKPALASTQLKQSDSSACNSVKLLSYYQLNGLGCPHYRYFDLPDKTVQAQLVNPINQQVVCGQPSVDKVAACESVAEEVLRILENPSKSQGSVPCIPPPPRNWCQQPQETKELLQDRKDITPSSKSLANSINAPPFVPLQAVRNHVNKNVNTKDCYNRQSNSRAYTEDNAFKNQILKPNSAPVSTTQKPFRKRTMRIAANFSNNFQK
ncbi:3' exoribonuclease [Holotrichia oblita]|uniref:3' exoribonuclease n=1 Tax=Holotrichia oblita TaxID=644536 RepID=A0ACB9TEJ6_HOLOL|nr:3' exoribonuclease [Holotrichia oblita]